MIFNFICKTQMLKMKMTKLLKFSFPQFFIHGFYTTILSPHRSPIGQ